MINGVREWMAGLWDPDDLLASLWRMVSSPYVAGILLLIVTIALGLREMLPQRPAEAVSNQAAFNVWLAALQQQYPRAARWLMRLGLTDIDRAVWFRAVLGLLALNLLLSLGNLIHPLAHTAHPVLAQVVTLMRRIDDTSSEEKMTEDVTELLRAQHYRVLLDGDREWRCADRFVYPALGVTLGLLLIVGGALVSERTAWWEEKVPLRPGQVRLLGHGLGLAVRVDDAAPAHDDAPLPSSGTALTILNGTHTVARKVVTTRFPVFYGGIFFQEVSSEPAMLVRAQDARDTTLTLQTPETGETRFTQVALSFQEGKASRYIVVLNPGAGTPGRSFEQMGNEQYVIVPDRDLSLRVIWESTATEGPLSFHVEAFEGNATVPSFNGDITGTTTMEIGGDRYTFTPQRVAVVRFGQDYGVFVALTGVLLLGSGLALLVRHRPQRVWFLSRLAGNEMVLHLFPEGRGAQHSPWFKQLIEHLTGMLGMTHASPEAN